MSAPRKTTPPSMRTMRKWACEVMRKDVLRNLVAAAMLVLMMLGLQPTQAASGIARAAAPTASETRVVRFSGYDWEVRPPGEGGPGPNSWDQSGVWVDAQGRLHLRLTRRGGRWQCAEVTSLRSFGFGRYQFQVTGRLDRLDPNVVFGLFDYPRRGDGPDGTNEIDIEYSRWGNPANFPAGATIYLAHAGPKPVSYPFPMPPGLIATTQRFIRRSDAVRVQCLRGHRDDDRGEYAHWAFRPADRQRVPQQALPVHINLWLMRGKPPQDGKEVEIIIRQFSFQPMTP